MKTYKDILNEAPVMFDLNKVQYKSKPLNDEIFIVVDRDTKGMRGSQDQFMMYTTDKNGKMMQYFGSHSSLKGAEKFGKNRGFMK